MRLKLIDGATATTLTEHLRLRHRQWCADRALWANPVGQTLDLDNVRLAVAGETATFDRALLERVLQRFLDGDIQGGAAQLSLFFAANAPRKLAKALSRAGNHSAVTMVQAYMTRQACRRTTSGGGGAGYMPNAYAPLASPPAPSAPASGPTVRPRHEETEAEPETVDVAQDVEAMSPPKKQKRRVGGGEPGANPFAKSIMSSPVKQRRDAFDSLAGAARSEADRAHGGAKLQRQGSFATQGT